MAEQGAGDAGQPAVVRDEPMQEANGGAKPASSGKPQSTFPALSFYSII